MKGIHELSVIALYFSVNLKYFKIKVYFLKKDEEQGFWSQSDLFLSPGSGICYS